MNLWTNTTRWIIYNYFLIFWSLQSFTYIFSFSSKYPLKRTVNLILKGVFAKNERRYRLNAIKKRFWSLLILLLSVGSIMEKIVKNDTYRRTYPANIRSRSFFDLRHVLCMITERYLYLHSIYTPCPLHHSFVASTMEKKLLHRHISAIFPLL